MKPRTLIVWTVLSLAVCLLLAGTASGQTPVKNPTTVSFTASADHASVTRYEMGWFAGGAEPVQVSDLGLGTPDQSNVIARALPSYPIGVTYTARVRAYAGTINGDWSADSNPFFRTPATPGPPVIR